MSEEAYNYISYCGVKREILIWGRGCEGEEETVPRSTPTGEGRRRGASGLPIITIINLTECASSGSCFALFVCLFVCFLGGMGRGGESGGETR